MRTTAVHRQAPVAHRGSTLRALLLVAGLLCASYLLVGPSRVAGPSADLPTEDEAAIPGYRRISFLTLSGFDYREGASRDALPDAVRQAHGQKVALRGFMLPIEAAGDGVARFLLNGSYDMCMFGASSGSPNQWVDVVMPPGRPADYTHRPITVVGALTVGEQRNGGRLYALYRLDADRVLAAP